MDVLELAARARRLAISHEDLWSRILNDEERASGSAMRAPISTQPAANQENQGSVEDLTRDLGAITLDGHGSSGDGSQANGCPASAASVGASPQSGAAAGENSFLRGSEAHHEGGWESESEGESGYETGLDTCEPMDGHRGTPHAAESPEAQPSPASSFGENSALGSTSSSDAQSRGDAVWDFSDDSGSGGGGPDSESESVIEIDGDSPARDQHAAPPPPSPAPPVSSATASVIGTPSLSKAAFRRRQAQLARDTFLAFNRRVFEGALPTNLPITWNKRLRNTGGRCFMRRRPLATAAMSRDAAGTARDGAWEYQAEIELAPHVVDSVHRLEHVLLHEMCHAAAWLVHHVHKPPHGKHFKYWGAKASREFPSLHVERCHSFRIDYKHTYRCTNDSCGATLGRHSRSIDVSRQVCGKCGAALVEVAGGDRRGGATPRKPNAYSEFVREHYAQTKRELGPVSGGEVMRALAQQWRERKQAVGASTL